MFLKSIFSKIRFLLILALLLPITSCNNNLEKNLKKLDEIYGYCDNPQRNIRKKEYERCKAKEMAEGPSGKGSEKEPINLTNLFDGFGGNKEQILISSVNNYLWQASLEVTSNYVLEIADKEGGIVQTEWINDSSIKNQRCKIKIQITSKNLVSNGVNTKLICENDLGNGWERNNQSFVEDEKRISLRILELAQNKLSLDSLS